MERIGGILDRILARITQRRLEEEKDIVEVAREVVRTWGLPEPEGLWVEGETLWVWGEDPVVRQELSARSGEWVRAICQRMGAEVIRKIQWKRRRLR